LIDFISNWLDGHGRWLVEIRIFTLFNPHFNQFLIKSSFFVWVVLGDGEKALMLLQAAKDWNSISSLLLHLMSSSLLQNQDKEERGKWRRTCEDLFNHLPNKQV